MKSKQNKRIFSDTINFCLKRVCFTLLLDNIGFVGCVQNFSEMHAVALYLKQSNYHPILKRKTIEHTCGRRK